jgi:PelA/Pel-15E family pectate lyase
LEQSRKLALADEAAVQAEVAANRMTSALRAPDGGDFKLPAPAGDPWYAGDEARQLAEAVLSYQTPSGGWSKHIGFSRGPRKPGMQWTSQNEPGRPAHYVATFDNRSTTEQLHFLAHMWRATRGETYKAAFLKGLNFILAAQYPCGGWPQVFPLEGGYHDNITLNDDATVHIFEVLSAVARGEPGYDFVNEPQRQQAAAALAAGIDCVLKMQVQQNGTRTVWCGQHDPLTLRPAAARIMEPATLSGLESARMLKFLMTIADPEPQVAVCIEAGLTWLEAARITNVRKATENGKTVYVVDSKSDEVYWARFYDLASSRPVFPGRDGELYESFAAMAAKNDLGYDYYTTLPGSIVTNGQKKWRKMLAESGGKPKQ